GGLIDCHRHLDRENTLDEKGYSILSGGTTLQEKWNHIDRVKQAVGYRKSLKNRMREAIRDMMEQGVWACRTYIDADRTIGLEGIKTAIEIKHESRMLGFFLQIAASPVKGILFEKDRIIFEEGCELADVIGALPSRDRAGVCDYETSSRQMRYFFELARRMKKPIDLQIDQANDRREWESKILVKVTREFRDRGYTHPVTATHCISLGAQYDTEIRRIAREFKELNISVVTCPGAALSMLQDKRNFGPKRNSIAPVRELLEEGVVVALGVDNVSDLFMPFTNGSIREELRELARAIRWQEDLNTFANIATTNGRLVLGLPLPADREP
ncbi:MAG: amidohydrolase family protein, partial [Candidatus Sungbacteria bacterium]|nr:amidohydrolase family protein [Candidatus Sungbacteria bacterium]